MATVKATPKSLMATIKERSKVEFEFTDIVPEQTTDGQDILRVMLKTPIPEINGRTVNFARTNTSVPLQAFDVQYVRFNPEAIAEIEKAVAEGKSPFTWDEGQEGKAGKFSSIDLKFDIAARTLEVWVVKTSLAAAANQNRNNGADGLKERIAKFKAEAEMKKQQLGEGNTVKPETVA